MTQNRQENLIFSVAVNKRKQLKVISTTYRETKKLKIAIKVIIVTLVTFKNTAWKTIFPQSRNIMESSKRPSKYHLFSIATFRLKKIPYFISPKSSKQKLSGNQVIWFKKRSYFPSPESSKQWLLKYHASFINTKERSFYQLPGLKKIFFHFQKFIILSFP